MNADFVVNPAFHKTGGLKYLTKAGSSRARCSGVRDCRTHFLDGNLAGTIVNGGDIDSGNDHWQRATQQLRQRQCEL